MTTAWSRFSLVFAIFLSLGAACAKDGLISGGPHDAATDLPPDISSGQQCFDSGNRYAIGERFKKDCNTCTCTSSGIACTVMACLPQGTGGAAGTGGAWGTGGKAGAGGMGGDLGSGGNQAGTGGAPSPPDAMPQGCTQGGQTYAIGEGINLDCNRCTCTAQGFACTAKACFHDAGPDLTSSPDATGECALSANLTFGPDGGNAIYRDVYRLTVSTFTITRNYSLRADRDSAATATCSPSLPACAASSVTVATINADLADPDVKSLWTLPQDPVPLFGADLRAMDGTVYSIVRDDGHKLLVGSQCASPVMNSCRYISAGLVRLTQDLQKLAASMLTDPVCKGL